MKIKVDVDKCIGAGLCVLAAPKVFAQDEDTGLVILLQEEPAEDQHEAVREAARLCPALVISCE
ncbi:MULTISPECIES: ferredoxin [Burkholderia cepacia complex]|uniref:Ferredoxin n=2 Tax=Burkholderia cepacia complex TaxID=87882 RepID=A0A8A8DFN0_9BURK|nr:ferredoxin [Burkholderia seminalis]